MCRDRARAGVPAEQGVVVGGRADGLRLLVPAHCPAEQSYATAAIYGMNPVPRETVLDTIQKHAYDFAPGERFQYNNSGYYLLGPILEAVTGVPYAQYLQERIFEPLGLEGDRASALTLHQGDVVTRAPRIDGTF